MTYFFFLLFCTFQIFFNASLKQLKNHFNNLRQEKVILESSLVKVDVLGTGAGAPTSKFSG